MLSTVLFFDITGLFILSPAKKTYLVCFQFSEVTNKAFIERYISIFFALGQETRSKVAG